MTYLAVIFALSYLILILAAYSGKRKVAISLLLVNIVMVVCAISLVVLVNSTNLNSIDSKSLIAFGQILSIGASAKFLFYLLQKDKRRMPNLEHSRGLMIPISLIGVWIAIFLKTYGTKFSQDLQTTLFVDSVAYAVGAFSVAAFVSTLEHAFEKSKTSPL